MVKKSIYIDFSIFWVIKRFIRVRQVIADIRQVEGKEGRKSCALVLEPGLIRTEIRSFRAFQGWRYFAVDDAPALFVLVEAQRLVVVQGA